ncbi:MAG: carboxypeptidase-like regulatory domain-containing protein [Bacteroidales bacterium]|nr:carboxypeptidase-like regulatory domain-containing protein [Bacteroidales bacterium]MDD3860768.1 carboxypeptidase-like regulatory domain-containing protein [Bacteroidales bacterium]
MKNLMTLIFVLTVLTASATNVKTLKSDNNKDGNSVSTTSYSGKITDSLSKEALTGVKISIENTDITVYSDLEGNFTINLPENTSSRNLKISYISYEEKTMDMTEITNGSIEINPVF